MSLILIASPIGNLDDISLRALKKLKDCLHIIGEEPKVLRRRLSHWGISPREKKLFCLNEHTTTEEVNDLTDLCQKYEVALLTDCGTPSFFDPGFQLVKKCKDTDVAIESIPGVSSLTALMPFLPFQTQNFLVAGFPPREAEQRKVFFNQMAQSSRPVFFMDTPYRLKKSIEDLVKSCPNFYCVLGINLTCENELVLYGKPSELFKKSSHLKKENFVCMVYPKGY